jgi:3-oxoacyl-[acyl-carrier protein] reductase
VATDGITANIVLPGRIATQRIHQLDEARAKRENIPLEKVVAQSVSAIPAARYGKPGEYGDVVTFLASTRASYVTGSVIRIDGGYIASI